MKTSVARMIKRTEWYRQGGAAVMWYVSPPWSIFTSLTVFGKRIPVTFRNMIGHNAKDFFTMYWTVPSMHRVAKFYIKKQLADASFIKRLRSNWNRTIIPQLDRMINEIRSTDLRLLSEHEHTKLSRRFVAQYRLAWSESIFHDAFDLVATELIRSEYLENKNRVSQTCLELLFAPTEPLVMQQEQFELARLAQTAAHNRQLARRIQINAWKGLHTAFPKFFACVIQHQQRYFWMFNDYEHVVDIPTAAFMRRIRRLLQHSFDLRCDLKCIESIRRSTSKKDRLMRALKLTPRQKALISLLTTIQIWRDERKAMSQRAHTVMRQFGKECMRRGGLPERELRCAFYWDWDKVLHPTAAFRKELRLRTNGVVHRIEGATRRTIAIGPICDSYKRLLDERIQKNDLRGMPAYTGIVRGKARIILNQVDFPKFKIGDVLITPNTRPEYIQIMKKASAIVTEEGGITSHAAIVSRELRIPAIVGVQGVLEAFNNGDLIEVDATKGTVLKV